MNILMGMSLLTAFSLSPTVLQLEKSIKLSERALRARATTKVMPAYPREARKAGIKGVVVAEVFVSGLGEPVEVNILQSPVTAIGTAVVNAVNQWRFKPAKLNGEAIGSQGKLTFYYVIKRGRAQVTEPL